MEVGRWCPRSSSSSSRVSLLKVSIPLCMINSLLLNTFKRKLRMHLWWIIVSDEHRPTSLWHLCTFAVVQKSGYVSLALLEAHTKWHLYWRSVCRNILTIFGCCNSVRMYLSVSIYLSLSVCPQIFCRCKRLQWLGDQLLPDTYG